MNNIIPVSKDLEHQQLIPTDWRETFSAIVSAFARGDFSLKTDIAGVRPISTEDAKRFAKNIDAYGARLVDLPEDAWQTSVCQSMNTYWDVVVDLFTEEEGASDLALIARVYESPRGYEFEIQSVHVP